MTLNRFAKKRDSTEGDIVKALRKAGVHVWLLDTPCDLLTYWAGLWLPLEVKAEKGKLTAEQEKMVEEQNLRIVRSPEDALRAVGLL